MKEELIEMIKQLEESSYLEIAYGFVKTALENQASTCQKKDI